MHTFLCQIQEKNGEVILEYDDLDLRFIATM